MTPSGREREKGSGSSLRSARTASGKGSCPQLPIAPIEGGEERGEKEQHSLRLIPRKKTSEKEDYSPSSLPLEEGGEKKPPY